MDERCSLILPLVITVPHMCLAISKPRSWFRGRGEECGGTDLAATHFLVLASVTNRSAA